MDGYSVLCLLLAGGGVLFGLIQRLRARRQLVQMDRMLDRALEGQFQETTFDESAPSALEAKLARFLNGSAASARGLAEERGKIAALIADISHQTKTPIAALLLGKYRAGSGAALTTVDSDGETIASLELEDQILDLSAAGRYVAVLTAAAIVYAVPLTVMGVALALTYRLDIGICLGVSFGALALAFVAVAVIDRLVVRRRPDYMPKMVRIVAPGRSASEPGQTEGDQKDEISETTPDSLD